MVYIVTYDLRKETTSESYQKLISLIKQDGIWACLGGSSYLIKSNLSAVELRDRFKAALDNNDSLYVGVVTAPAAWSGYSKEISEWIKNNL
jgi:hypothetical protein